MKIFILYLLINFLLSCSNNDNKNTKSAVIDSASPQIETSTDTIPLVNERTTTVIKHYPKVGDTSVFISKLLHELNLKVEENPFVEQNQKITFYKKIFINGSNEHFYMIEYDYGAGSMASYPWKMQFLIDKKGKLVGKFSAINYKLINIFPKQKPLLLIASQTAKGNGGHDIYKIKNNELFTVYDNKLKTIDEHEDMQVFSPGELNLKIIDTNKDGFNDLIFSGNKLMLGKYTKDSFWYDVENDKPFTPANPASILPVKYIFIYDTKTEQFLPKERYLELH